MIRKDQPVQNHSKSWLNFLGRVKNSLSIGNSAQTPKNREQTELYSEETVELGEHQKGQAASMFSLSTDEMIDKWVAFSHEGNHLPLNIEDPDRPEKALIKVAEQYFSKEQTILITQFIQELLRHDNERVSTDHKYVADKSFMDLFRDGLLTQGMTFEQLDAISTGDFNFDAYKKMILTKTMVP